MEKLPKIGKYFSNFFGVGSPENLNNLDFTSFLEGFYFSYFDENEEIQSEDILDRYLRVQLDIGSKLEPKKVFERLISDFNKHQEVEEE